MCLCSRGFHGSRCERSEHNLSRYAQLSIGAKYVPIRVYYDTILMTCITLYGAMNHVVELSPLSPVRGRQYLLF